MSQHRQQSLINFIKGLKQSKLIPLAEQFLLMEPPQLDEDFRHRSYIAFELLQEIYNKDSLINQTDQHSLLALRKNYESYLSQLNQIKSIEKNRRDLQDRLKIERTQVALLKKEISKNDSYLRVLKKHIKNFQLIRQKPKPKVTKSKIKEVDQQISLMRSQIQFQAGKFRSSLNSANDKISKRCSSDESRTLLRRSPASPLNLQSSKGELPSLKAKQRQVSHESQNRLQEIKKIIQLQKQKQKETQKQKAGGNPPALLQQHSLQAEVSVQKVRKNTKQMTFNPSVLTRRQEAQRKFIKLKQKTSILDRSPKQSIHKSNSKLVDQDKIIEVDGEAIQQKSNKQMANDRIGETRIEKVHSSKKNSLKLSEIKLDNLNISIINKGEVNQLSALSNSVLEVEQHIPSVKVLKQIEIDQLTEEQDYYPSQSYIQYEFSDRPLKKMKRTFQPPLVSEANAYLNIQNMWKIK